MTYKDGIGEVTIGTETTTKRTLEHHINKRNEWYHKVVSYKCLNKNDTERMGNAMQYIVNYTDGSNGRLEELFSVQNKSTKTHVSAQGKKDAPIKFQRDDGKIVTRWQEIKTNGGRIGEQVQNLLKGKDTIFMYRLSICNKSTSYQTRETDTIVCMFSTFWEMLLECNAIKETNGTNNELAIQASSKRLYEKVKDYPIIYDPSQVYCSNDFDLTF